MKKIDKRIGAAERLAQRLSQQNAELAIRVDKALVSKKKVKTKKKARGKPPRPSGTSGDSRVTRERLHQQLHPHLKDYFASIANPWAVTGVRCPVNYNPVPSFVTQYARTTATASQVSVANGTSANLILFPGHSMMNTPNLVAAPDAIYQSDFDEVAYHSYAQVIGSTAFVIGPGYTVNGSAAYGATGGAMVKGLSSGTWAGSTTSGTASAFGYDQTLPYVLNVGVAGHSRWKLVSMGVTIENVTPELSRGGSIVSYQPINNQIQGANPVGFYAQLPTFKDHGSAGAKITWIPRMRDLAYWHLTPNLSSGVAPTNSNILPGISVLLTPPSGANNDQVYDIQVVWNWELAGSLFAPIGTPGPHMPEAKPVVERTHSVLVNTTHTASSALQVATRAAADVKAGLGVVTAAAGAVGSIFGK